ncbi:MAG TPA: hypothetical protein VH139_10115 [Acidobacteriaceae bacterium]|nr:hypothetical protein [Acidobacteriaceae bacterium]
MSVHFASLLSRGAIHRLSLAGAAVLGTVSGALAGPAALVENVVGYSGAEVMSYVHEGETIRLGSHETIALTYLNSCVQEIITGGTVTVGIDYSKVQDGRVDRTKVDCERKFMLTGNSETHVAGRALRGQPE